MTNNHRRKLWLPIHHCRWVPWSLTERCIILSTRKYHKIKLVIIMYTYQINVGIQVAFSRLPPLLYDYNRNLRVKDIGLEFLTVSVIITPTKSPRTGFLVRKGPYRVALGNQVKLARAFFIRQICGSLNRFFIRFSIFLWEKHSHRMPG